MVEVPVEVTVASVRLAVKVTEASVRVTVKVKVKLRKINLLLYCYRYYLYRRPGKYSGTHQAN